MKREAKKRLIKDVVIAIIAWSLFGIIFSLMLSNIGGFLIAIIFAGLPFGWRWMSKVIVATSFLVVIIKGILAVLLGWIAIFVVIIGDIITYKTADE